MPKDFFKNFEKDINNILKKDLEKRVNRLAKNMVGKVKHHIQQEVYDVYKNPKRYERTHNLETSITKEINSDSNKITADIFADDSIAVSHHMYDSGEPLEPYSEIVETGIGYDFNYPYKYNQSRSFMGEAFKQNEQFIVNEINKVISDFTKK